MRFMHIECCIACDTSNETPLFIMCEQYTHGRVCRAALLFFNPLYIPLCLRLSMQVANERMSTTPFLMIVINGLD